MHPVKTYEAMFLFDSSKGSEWTAIEAEVNRILTRAEAKILGVKNWDDRKLAYPIRQQKRGLYVLSYFQCGADKITGIERDVHLSEVILRVLVLNRDTMTEEQITAALAAAPPPKSPSRGDEWSPRPRSFEGGPDAAPDDRGGVAVADIPDDLDIAGVDD
jgi:ribosomal protein S6